MELTTIIHFLLITYRGHSGNLCFWGGWDIRLLPLPSMGHQVPRPCPEGTGGSGAPPGAGGGTHSAGPLLLVQLWSLALCPRPHIPPHGGWGGKALKPPPWGGGGAHTHIMTTRTRLCRPQHARDTSEWRRGSSLSRGGGFAPGTIPLASGLMPTSPLPRPRGLPGQRERGTTGMEKDEMPPSCPIPGAPSQKKPRERGRDGHGGAHPPPQPRDLKLPELNEGLCHP